MVFGSAQATDFADAFRLSLTKSDGSEANEVIFIEKEKLAAVDALASEIELMMKVDRTVGMAALSRVIWSALKKD